MIISLILTPDIPVNAIGAPLAFYVTHRLMVALKYASMTKTEYEKYMSAPDRAVTAKYMAQVQIIMGILNKNSATIKFEIAAAAARLGLRLGDPSMRFRVLKHPSSQVKRWEQLLCFQDVIEKTCADPLFSSKSAMAPEDETAPVKESNVAMMIPVSEVCIAILMQAGNYNRLTIMSVFSWLRYAVTIVVVAIPFTTQFPDRVTAGVIVFYATATLLGFVYLGAIFAFLAGAVFDALRQQNVAEMLGEMIEVKQGLSENLSAVALARQATEEQTRTRSSSSMWSVDDSQTLQTRHMAERKSSASAKGMQTFSVTDSAEDDSEEEGAEDVLTEMPRVAFNCPANVFAFLETRHLLQNFGYRFRFRLDIYVGE